ncbi:uncharacterized protein TM35_000131260 [Trypanosoma theileri]|uniref:RING-type E3 ubiquitin transferase n=1 Tax=Trypanosoma theileri TaxID=67003 RepID=A0A1X0NWR2_9TRYP|nr:uncharacterized protein TM35_000131260 [Trypanosoma theileri]ORC89122.1 hypothetical protein TM35_000131260 [Trypanosoma theileri]
MRGSNSSKRARSESMERSSSSSENKNNNNNNENSSSSNNNNDNENSARHVNAGRTNNMNSNNNNMSSTPTPVTQPSSATDTPPRDLALEEQMERLEVDEDFKASLRSMSPNSRREVLEDVIRAQQNERFHRSFGVAARLGSFPLDAALGGLLNLMAMNVADDSSDGETGVSLLPDQLPSPPQTRQQQQQQQQQQQSGAGGLHNDALPDPSPFGIPLIGFMRASRMLRENTDFVRVMEEIIARRNLGITEDVDEMSYEELLELQERIGYASKGITKEQMRECLADVARPSDGTCVVCQGEWQEGDAAAESAVELKKCHHVFHRACIEQWLGSNKTCPVCKQEVL